MIALLLICAFNGNIFAESSAIPQDVLTVANDGVKFVKTKMESNPERWGFSDVNEVNRLTLGEGFRVNYIGSDKLSKASGNSLAELIDPNIIETWEFTLDLDGNPKVFLTVAFENGAYQVVHFGGNADSFGIAKSNFKSLANDKGVTSKPTLISAGKTYYFLSELNDEELILPVKSGSNASIKDNDQLRPASEIINELKDIKKDSAEGTRRGGSTSNIASTTTIGSKSNSIMYLTIAIGLALVAAIVVLTRRRIKARA